MWLIVNLSSGQFFHLINEKSKYVIGRAGADIVLKNDTSISRTHASLEFKNVNQAELLTIVDSGSKYGTFYNEGIATNCKMNVDEPIEIHNEDRIRFGLLQNEWKVKRIHLVSMTSALQRDKASEFEKHIQALGGRMIAKWERSCTHLTMTEITVTIKVLYALLNNVPIVTCEYWRDLLQKARTKAQATLPQAVDYLPAKSDLLVNKTELNFGFRAERNTLFAGKTFVFMHKKHFDMYGPIVQMAGGGCKNLNSGVQKSFLIKSNVVVIQYVPSTESQSSQTISNISAFLESNSRRIIPEYEIGLAIVNCSIQKYCNPTYKLLTDLMPATMSLAVQHDELLLGNTRIPTARLDIDTELVVPETDRTVSQSYSNSDILADDSKMMSTSSVESANDMDIISLKSKKDSSKVTGPFDRQLDNDTMPNIVVTESASVESQIKRKRPSSSNAIVLESDDENDELYLPKSKKQTLNKVHDRFVNEDRSPNLAISSKDSNLVSKTGATIKPLPIIVNKNKNTVSTVGFLNKTQTQPSQQQKDETSAVTGRQPMEACKRGRIAIITDDDSGDENDLFNFGGPSTANVSKKLRTDNSFSQNIVCSDDDELFGFTKTHAEKTISSDEDDLPPTQEFKMPEGKTQSKSMSKPTPKIIPTKVSTEGWLCRSFNKILKDEVKSEVEVDNITLESKEYLDSLKGGFQVRTHSVLECSKKSIVNTSTDILNTSKNFKTFVKKCNYNPQNHVMAVVRVSINPLR